MVNQEESAPAAHAYFDAEHEYWIVSGAFAGEAFPNRDAAVDGT